MMFAISIEARGHIFPGPAAGLLSALGPLDSTDPLARDQVSVLPAAVQHVDLLDARHGL